MKKKQLVASLILGASVFLANRSSIADQVPFVLFPNSIGDSEHPDLGTERAVFKIAGMSDIGDKEKIESKIWKVKGVRSVTFKMQERLAEIVFQKKQTNSRKLVKAFHEAGFDVTKID